jgi:hypothetical protein
MNPDIDAERQRLEDADRHGVAWRRWGPYLSERQWGTVREDYSASGDAWSYFTHDQARSRAYRWGEDGIAGISDDKQRLCFALALWNGRDPILKERMFGLTNAEGNHGEDVKEYYFYLDSTPTHSYLRYLYKYPQAAYPYTDLVATNGRRTRLDFEYELLDTGVFDDDRYFDVLVEYAKAAPEDLLVRVTVHNRGPEDATLHLLPTLWFRNTWSWDGGTGKPRLLEVAGPPGTAVVAAEHEELGDRWLYCEGGVPLLFTENETNNERLFGSPNASGHVKDGIDRYVVHGEGAAVNPARTGTKAAAHHLLTVPAGGSSVVRLRLNDADPAAWELADPSRGPFGPGFDSLVAQRRAESDAFYDGITPPAATAEERQVVRQGMAGMLWTKQYYYLDVERWLHEHGVDPWSSSAPGRNHEWFHMRSDDILSMPDTWEYPWFAAWDLAFHTIALAYVDTGFAKQQLDLLVGDLYLHPNGQLPAYEWNFGDVNPPVHAWATLFVYELENQRTGTGDLAFLERVFQKLLTNFTWWINRKDPDGNNVFQGGFLGLDNIGVFDRSAPLPTGGNLEQADGTAWMALYCQNMLRIALELAKHNPVYEELALKFVEHSLWIGVAVNRIGTGQDTLWDSDDGFFYDLLRFPDGGAARLKVRSMVGLLPLAAATVIRYDEVDRFPHLIQRVRDFIGRHPTVTASLAETRAADAKGGYLLALVGEKRLRLILDRMLDEDEFLSPHGIRSLSQYHAEHPYSFWVHGEEFRVGYLPAESDTGMFGGNSNWRGPVWFPVNVLIIRALLNLYSFYGDKFTVECPTGSGRQLNLFEVSEEIAARLTRIFLPGADGTRPVYGGQAKFQDPHWRDLLLFHEYFHGDNGAGLGASHQTGWTGLVAGLIVLFGTDIAADLARYGGDDSGPTARQAPG